MVFIIILAIILLVFIGYILIKAITFKPYKEEKVQPFEVDLNKEQAIKNLREMIRCKTVSYTDTSLEDVEEFKKFRELLKELYPAIHETCARNTIGRTGILYHWKGKSATKPTVYMAHYDVVPVEVDQWEQAPFEGIIKDGSLWGRGTLDTKGTLCGIIEATEKLILEGFIPENDIYLSFSGDEETNGSSTPAIVDYLKQKGIQPYMVLDEGGAIVEGVLPGVKGKMALVGTGEKGKAHIKLTIKSQGGHASSPPPHSPVGVLAKAIYDVENKPLTFRLSTPAEEMFDTLGRHASFGMKIIYANIKLFSPILNIVSKKIGGEINALLRSTIAFTKMSASNAVNVFSPSASVEGDLRIVDGDTKDSIIEDLKNRINNEKIEIESLYTSEVRPFSKTGTEVWDGLKESIQQVWPDVIVSPYLMIACSDSRHFTEISEDVFRFSAMELSSEERGLIHGHNERIPLEKIATTIKFFICMMKKC